MTDTNHPKAVTANRLDDGTVVYLDESFLWTGNWAEARLLTAPSEVEDVLKIVERARLNRQVVAAYAIDVEIDNVNGAISPLRFREKIRAHGPTTLRAA